MIVYIHYKTGHHPWKTFKTNEDEIIIGRGAEGGTQLQLTDGGVSRPHARLFFDVTQSPRGWWLEDLGSRNGTFYQSERVFDAVYVEPGERFYIGETELHLNFNTGPLNSAEIERFDNWDPSAPPTPSEVMEDASEHSRKARMSALGRISEVLVQYSGQFMLSSILHEMRAAFPLAEHQTIVLQQDEHWVPRAYWPKRHAFVSFTLVDHVLHTSEPVLWRMSSEQGAVAHSLKDATSAIYAPIIWMNDILGVLHVSTSAVDDEFTNEDLRLLTVIANIIAPALQATADKPMERIPYVFVSYSRRDKEFVARLAKDLRRYKILVWYDTLLNPGEEWRPQLMEQIAKTDAIVLVMSPPAVQSEYVQWEIEVGQRLNKKVYPLMYRKCEPPEEIRELQYIDISTDEDRYQLGIKRLVEELRTDTRNLDLNEES